MICGIICVIVVAWIGYLDSSNLFHPFINFSTKPPLCNQRRFCYGKKLDNYNRKEYDMEYRQNSIDPYKGDNGDTEDIPDEESHV